jgi:hypothetical protein
MDELVEVVPQTFGEAIQKYPWIADKCEPHEWDNRTTIQNTIWLILKFSSRKESNEL